MKPEILALAKKAGLEQHLIGEAPEWCGFNSDLERFYLLAQAKALEEEAERARRYRGYWRYWHNSIWASKLDEHAAQKRKEAESC